MKRVSKSILSTALVAGLSCLMVWGSADAAKGGIPGPPSNGEEAGNNLSFPAVSETIVPVIPRWNMPATPVLGEHFSYGCDQGETMGQYSYPNTSCVDDLADPQVYFTPEECTDEEQPSPCKGLPVDRIYWQKVEANDWWAESDLGTPPRQAAYLDWGDALESQSWNVKSQIRVETQPYGSLLVDPITNQFYRFNPELETCADVATALGLADACRLGFQMWHVSGQGITEHWGVRADDATTDPYNYDSPFQIIQTNEARLNLAKLVPGSATCPTASAPGELPPNPELFTWVFDEEADQGTWDGACEVDDLPYSVELSVGGKYVYGYNWRMKNVELESLCTGWEKTGYYRLTFYTTNGFVKFDPDNPVLDVTAPPGVTAEASPVPIIVAAAEEEESGPLYTPVIDYENNLTYLDICIIPKEQGGGNGGRPDR